METKVCIKCDASKPFGEFNIKKSATDGLDPRCKECKKKMNRMRYEQRYESINERTKRWQELNRERVREYARNYYHANKNKSASVRSLETVQ